MDRFDILRSARRDHPFVGFRNHMPGLHHVLLGRMRILMFLIAYGASCALASPTSGEAEMTDFSRRVWRMEDGLPQSRIQAISQTREGYLWIGTSGGLVRFDGVRFVVFDHSNTPTFRDDSVLALHPARDGSLWIGTEGGGVLHYQNGKFHSYARQEGLTNTFVRTVFEDRQGRVWAGTDRGFFRFDRDHFVRLDGTPALPYVSVRTIHEDTAGRLWMGGGTGLFTVEGDVLTRHESRLGTTPIRSIANSGGGSLWVATAVAGLWRLQGGAASVVQSNVSDIQTLCDDANGNVWLGTRYGLVRLRGASVTTYRASTLPDNTVLSAFEDRESNLWFGTQDGLVRLSKNLVETLTMRDGLSDDNVSTVYRDRSETLWIGTGNGRVYKLADERIASVPLPRRSINSPIRAILEDRSGTFWIGSSSGVIRLEGSKATRYTTAEGLRSNDIRAFLQDRNGHLWIGTASGISRWDGSRFHSYYIEDGLAYGGTRALLEDRRNGDIWVGTDGGLNRIRDRRFVPDQFAAKIGNERIWTIHQDADNAIWLGTRGRGIYRIKNGVLRNLGTREGLPSNTIYQILEDRNRQLWCSSPAGVFRIALDELNAVAENRARTFAVVLYGTADGLAATQMNGGSQPVGTLSADGHVWFANVKGLVHIDPDLVRPVRTPPVLIEEVIVNEKPVDENPLGMNRSIRLAPGSGKLEIHFTALHLLSPEQIGFRYKLEGFDTDWTVTTRRTAFYTGLPPGHYRFRAVATDLAAPDSSSEASLAFELAPRFYQTNWFLAFSLGLAGFLVWAGLRIYARQTQARYAMLLEERTRLAREMHDTVIQGCVGVSTLLEAASSVEMPDARLKHELMNRARMQVRLTLDEARHAVWDLRHNPQGSGLVVTLDDFAQQFSAGKNISIETEVAGIPIKLDERTERNLVVVAREALRNAVAHGNPRSIRIRLLFEPDEVTMEVVDDGCGFQPASDLSYAGHYGIVGMRERIGHLGGTFDLFSTPGQGTKVRVNVPLRERKKSMSGVQA